MGLKTASTVFKIGVRVFTAGSSSPVREALVTAGYVDAPRRCPRSPARSDAGASPI
jgi:hypothetical protein